MASKFVYFFGNGKAEGRGDQKTLLGGKGAGLAEMTNIGLPVPGGFTITTEACRLYYERKQKWPEGLEKQVRDNVRKLERACGKKLGDKKNPLLVSVRSGAAVSMPGMMETVLNLGLNDESVEGLARATDNARFAWDSYRRFIQMYSTVVVGLSKDVLEHKLEKMKESLGIEIDSEISAESLRELCGEFKDFFRDQTGKDFPQDPWEQLVGAINAVFSSWNADKAIKYREVEKIHGLPGTGVNIVQMVFGNMGDDSGTGVCFTRDPSSGENVFYGDLLMNAQGEDVVAGIRTPMALDELRKLSPAAYEQLCAVRVMLEVHYKEMQDLEFTIERGKLYMLQCRRGKRTPAATFKIAVDHATKPLLSKGDASKLVKKKYLPSRYAAAATKPVLTKDEAIERISATDIERLFYPIIDPDFDSQQLAVKKLGTGINAVPGAASGQIVFNASTAEKWAADGKKVILVRKETSPEDVGGMHVAQGILTATGGKTSHAAVVARGWGKCCIVGASSAKINESAGTMTINGKTLKEGDSITLDGSEGVIYQGDLPLVTPELPDEYYTLMQWCDARRRLKVRTNADTPYDAENAVNMGAEGIGLCRTEHMFFDTEERRRAIQEMILADSTDARTKALDKLLPFQRQDFIGIFEAMDGRPVTIRLVDPPLHEFVPHTKDKQQELADDLMVDFETVASRVEQLKESNPMLGHRGCRLAITYPEILDMQVRAIIEAAIECRRRNIKVSPEIMIPLCIDSKELQILTDRTRDVANEIIARSGLKVKYLVGTMIETPRAALTADRIAEVADFFSFGTNDLTQTVMALSRDDAGRFLPDYVDQNKSGIFPADPFQSIDIDGVGMLVEHAIEHARRIKKDLKIGICGEHGGDAESVHFCHRANMDYVSCSPYRVPIARLAAAQAVIMDGSAKRSKARAKPAPARKAPTKTKARRVAPKPTTKKKTSKAKAKASKTTKSARTATKSRKQSPPKSVSRPVAKKKTTTKRSRTGATARA
ncbi:MAG TPA: PEP/pyruvate-binding domain-containing protein [Phycisphaerae bacterium]|nr:PEP/pyruvate-binding domain-containing protein [Phycisphaerae bacterium]HRW52879.1 PEP/pyruvate-binding domain-containing protein [Phycisphaerae bacterium]